MIKSFRSKALRAYWTKGNAAGINPEWLKKVNLVLSTMDAAEAPEELNLPGLAFHSLKHGRRGEFAVSVSGNWRITFAWSKHDAISIDLEDYHD